MDIADIGQRFLDHQPIPGVVFEHNDYVHVIAGESSGKRGSLVTLVEIEPEPVYLVEIEWGGDVRIPQSQLKHADT